MWGFLRCGATDRDIRDGPARLDYSEKGRPETHVAARVARLHRVLHEAAEAWLAGTRQAASESRDHAS